MPEEEERRPLLDSNDCCSEQEGCCRYNKTKNKPPSTMTSLFISTNEQEDNDPTCQLSNQPWKHKFVALLCAMFLAGS